jgi:hypothetical protein
MAAVESVVVFDLRQQFDDAASAGRGGKELTRGASTELNARPVKPCGSLRAVAKYARGEFANILGIVPVHENNVTPTRNQNPQSAVAATKRWSTALGSGLPLPVNPQQIFFGIVVRLQPATMGVPEGFADAVRKVNVRCGHQETTIIFDNAHDALQRMLRLCSLLHVAHEIHEFRAVLRYVVAFKLHIARGIMITDAVARGAHRSIRPFRPRQPLPPAFVKDSAALRAYGRLLQLAARFIAVVHVFRKQLAPVNRLCTRSCRFWAWSYRFPVHGLEFLRKVIAIELHMPQGMSGMRPPQFGQAIDFRFGRYPVVQPAAQRESATLRAEVRRFGNHAAALRGRNGCHSGRTG